MPWFVGLLMTLLASSFGQSALAETQNQTVARCGGGAPLKRVVCYYQSELNEFQIEDLNPCLCTHLVYGSLGLDSDMRFTDTNEDAFKSMKALKLKNPDLKTLLSIRDSSVSGSTPFRTFASESNTTDQLGKKLRRMVRDTNTDGIDIEWVYENTNGTNSTQEKNVLTNFLKRLRTALDDVTLTLTTSKNPGHLVNGYDFRNISKHVDFINIPAFQFDLGNESIAKHHGRLHGVADMENMDSMVDLLLTMGANKEKIVIGIPTFGLSYKLSNESETAPGSPVENGQATVMTHSEICVARQTGNWTLVREKDQTAPYVYKGKTWIGFDDEISFKLKSKYILLRNLGGVMVWTANQDDYRGMCGNGRFPLLRSIRDVLSSSKTKSASNGTTDELEEYLDYSESRVVEIYDQAGNIFKTDYASTDTVEGMTCTRQGYYRHPADCTRFYRCVKFNQLTDAFSIFQYDCPSGLVFDERHEVCNWPSWSPPCDGSGEIMPRSASDFYCPDLGYFRDPENCRVFFYCNDVYGNGTLSAYEFKCPYNLAFDEERRVCDWPLLVSGCAEKAGLIGVQGGLASGVIQHGGLFGGSGLVHSFRENQAARPAGFRIKPLNGYQGYASYDIPRGSALYGEARYASGANLATHEDDGAGSRATLHLNRAVLGGQGFVSESHTLEHNDGQVLRGTYQQQQRHLFTSGQENAGATLIGLDEQRGYANGQQGGKSIGVSSAGSLVQEHGNGGAVLVGQKGYAIGQQGGQSIGAGSGGALVQEHGNGGAVLVGQQGYAVGQKTHQPIGLVNAGEVDHAQGGATLIGLNQQHGYATGEKTHEGSIGLVNVGQGYQAQGRATLIGLNQQQGYANGEKTHQGSIGLVNVGQGYLGQGGATLIGLNQQQGYANGEKTHHGSIGLVNVGQGYQGQSEATLTGLNEQRGYAIGQKTSGASLIGLNEQVHQTQQLQGGSLVSGGAQGGGYGIGLSGTIFEDGVKRAVGEIRSIEHGGQTSRNLVLENGFQSGRVNYGPARGPRGDEGVLINSPPPPVSSLSRPRPLGRPGTSYSHFIKLVPQTKGIPEPPLATGALANRLQNAVAALQANARGAGRPLSPATFPVPALGGVVGGTALYGQGRIRLNPNIVPQPEIEQVKFDDDVRGLNLEQEVQPVQVQQPVEIVQDKSVHKQPESTVYQTTYHQQHPQVVQQQPIGVKSVQPQVVQQVRPTFIQEQPELVVQQQPKVVQQEIRPVGVKSTAYQTNYVQEQPQFVLQQEKQPIIVQHEQPQVVQQEVRPVGVKSTAYQTTYVQEQPKVVVEQQKQPIIIQHQEPQVVQDVRPVGVKSTAYQATFIREQPKVVQEIRPAVQQVVVQQPQVVQQEIRPVGVKSTAYKTTYVQEQPKVVVQQQQPVIHQQVYHEQPQVVQQVYQEQPKLVQQQVYQEQPKLVQQQVYQEQPKLVQQQVYQEQRKLVQQQVYQEQPKVVQQQVYLQQPKVVQQQVYHQQPKEIGPDGVKSTSYQRNIHLEQPKSIEQVHLQEPEVDLFQSYVPTMALDLGLRQEYYMRQQVHPAYGRINFGEPAFPRAPIPIQPIRGQPRPVLQPVVEPRPQKGDEGVTPKPRVTINFRELPIAVKSIHSLPQPSPFPPNIAPNTYYSSVHSTINLPGPRQPGRTNYGQARIVQKQEPLAIIEQERPKSIQYVSGGQIEEPSYGVKIPVQPITPVTEVKSVHQEPLRIKSIHKEPPVSQVYEHREHNVVQHQAQVVIEEPPRPKTLELRPVTIPIRSQPRAPPPPPKSIQVVQEIPRPVIQLQKQEYIPVRQPPPPPTQFVQVEQPRPQVYTEVKSVQQQVPLVPIVQPRRPESVPIQIPVQKVQLPPPPPPPKSIVQVHIETPPKQQVILQRQPQVFVQRQPQVVIQEQPQVVVKKQPQVVVQQQQIYQQPRVLVQKQPEPVVHQQVYHQQPQVVVQKQPQVVVQQQQVYQQQVLVQRQPQPVVAVKTIQRPVQPVRLDLPPPPRQQIVVQKQPEVIPVQPVRFELPPPPPVQQVKVRYQELPPPPPPQVQVYEPIRIRQPDPVPIVRVKPVQQVQVKVKSIQARPLPPQPIEVAVAVQPLPPPPPKQIVEVRQPDPPKSVQIIQQEPIRVQELPPPPPPPPVQIKIKEPQRIRPVVIDVRQPDPPKSVQIPQQEPIRIVERPPKPQIKVVAPQPRPKTVQIIQEPVRIRELPPKPVKIARPQPVIEITQVKEAPPIRPPPRVELQRIKKPVKVIEIQKPVQIEQVAVKAPPPSGRVNFGPARVSSTPRPVRPTPPAPLAAGPQEPRQRNRERPPSTQYIFRQPPSGPKSAYTQAPPEAPTPPPAEFDNIPAPLPNVEGGGPARPAGGSRLFSEGRRRRPSGEGDENNGPMKVVVKYGQRLLANPSNEGDSTSGKRIVRVQVPRGSLNQGQVSEEINNNPDVVIKSIKTEPLRVPVASSVTTKTSGRLTQAGQVKTSQGKRKRLRNRPRVDPELIKSQQLPAEHRNEDLSLASRQNGEALFGEQNNRQDGYKSIDSEGKSIDQFNSAPQPIGQSNEGLKSIGQSREDGKSISQSNEGVKSISQSREGVKSVSQSNEGLKSISQSNEGLKSISQSREGVKSIDQLSSSVYGQKAISLIDGDKSSGSENLGVKSIDQAGGRGRGGAAKSSRPVSLKSIDQTSDYGQKSVRVGVKSTEKSEKIGVVYAEQPRTNGRDNQGQDGPARDNSDSGSANQRASKKSSRNGASRRRQEQRRGGAGESSRQPIDRRRLFDKSATIEQVQQDKEGVKSSDIEQGPVQVREEAGKKSGGGKRSRSRSRKGGKDALPDTACTRPGLFRHPDNCNKFYECFYDKWLNKFTLHMFECPIRLAFDEKVFGCTELAAKTPCKAKPPSRDNNKTTKE